MNAASEEPAKPRRHSNIGLVSVGLALTTTFLTLSLFVLYVIPESGTDTEQRFSRMFDVFALGIAPILYLAGLVLGIVGAFKKATRKRVAVLGIIFNGLPLALFVAGALLLLAVGVAVALSGGGWR